MSGGRDKKIAIIGAGIAGLTCANILNKDYEVEIFEAHGKDKESRPLQMEGGVHYCGFIPELEPYYPIKEIHFSSKNESVTWKGKMGYAYKIGGLDGIDARFRRSLEKKIKINYLTQISSVDELKEYDFIVAADGFRSRIARNTGMRYPSPLMWGVGIGSTVKGEFEIGSMESTFNADIAPGGYRYLIPISKNTATLACACIANKVDTRKIRDKLRDFASNRDYKILNEWTDFEKWYEIHTYTKDNIYLIGGAASLTEQSFGFGLKYSIESAKLCAKAIENATDYNALLKPLLKELLYWDKIGKWFINANNRDYDRLMRFMNISFVKNRACQGKSIKGLFRLLKLFKTKNPSLKQNFKSTHK
jgi:flavin-dependent dehydrogenase